ncbi:hypothetical protein [Streptomyces sp. NPDC007205]|uniref:hypothetical protein n=1 Tax=Streptomyces sp. NPDC007205 TaxID=3154316 RepID=UPI0033EDD8C7
MEHRITHRVETRPPQARPPLRPTRCSFGLTFPFLAWFVADDLGRLTVRAAYLVHPLDVGAPDAPDAPETVGRLARAAVGARVRRLVLLSACGEEQALPTRRQPGDPDALAPTRNLSPSPGPSDVDAEPFTELWAV